MSGQPGGRRLSGRARRAILASSAVAVVVLGVTLVIVLGSSGSGAPEAASASPTRTAPSTTPENSEPPPALDSEEGRSPYCTAFEAIRAGGLENRESEGTVDLAELSDTFDDLIGTYSTASEVAPRGLRDDYATVLGYLREGKKAVDSRDVNQIRALITNLSTLNDTISAIQSRSEAQCA